MTDHILLQLALALAGAKIGGEICERWLKLPAVLGEIVAGVLLGGSLLGWVNGENVTLQQIAEIGAVFLLFEVGLESDLDELFSVGAAALWVACAGVIFTLWLGIGVLHFMGAGQPPFLLHGGGKMQPRAAISSVAVIFCLLLATLAETVHLAPIVGAFAAGLVLAKTEHKVHFEEKIKSVADLFIPIFFVMMGAGMSLAALNIGTPVRRSTVF